MDDSAAQLEVRAPTEPELKDVFRVLTKTFDGWPGLGPDIVPREYLDWKCHSSPLSMDHHVVALHEGVIKSFMLRVDRKVRIRGEVLPAQSGGDSALIPELQGQGLFRRIRQYSVDNARDRGVALHLAYARHPAVVHLQSDGVVVPQSRLALLFKPINMTGAGERPVGIVASLRRLTIAAGVRAMALATGLRHGRSKPPADDGIIQPIQEFDASVDALWVSASQDFEFIPVRDREYLNWRYCDRRAGDFVVRAAREDGELVGYCVLKFVGGRAYIADLLVRSGRIDVVERLAWDADGLARQRDADGIMCQLPDGHAYRKTLLRAGFLDTRRKADFNIVPFSIDAKKLDFLTYKDARIHVMHGDSDLI